MTIHNWKKTTLGQFVVLQRGHDLPETNRQPGQVPVMGSFGVTGCHNKAIADGPGVTVGRSGASFGVVSYIQKAYWPLNTALYVRDFLRNNPRYAFYLLKTLDLVRYNSGSAQPSLNRNYINPLPVSVPPRAEQDAIAAALGALDDKIELNRRTNATLEAMARALFKSWFVDFDPVRAKAEGRAPAHMDAATAALFPDRFGENGLPEGWEQKLIGSLAEIVGGTTPNTKKPEFWEDGQHLWATPKDLSKLSAPVLLDTERKITDAGLAAVGSGLSPVGTVLLSSRAPIGYLTVTSRPTAINQGFIAIRPTANISTTFALCWCDSNMDKIKASANGSTFPEISKKNFRMLIVNHAPRLVLSVFNSLTEDWLAKIKMQEEESVILASLRDTLLPKLMSGEVRVREAEKALADAPL